MTDDDRPSTADIATQGANPTDERTDDDVASDAAAGAGGDGLEPLLGGDEASTFQERWQSIQAAFVDEPRRAVEEADSLVAELMQRLAQTFHEERENLEGQWSRGDDVSTEDLRVGLQRYRSFFQRLLAT